METQVTDYTPIGANHETIAGGFLTRVQEMLATGFSIKKYAIDTDWRITESLELQVSGNQKLQIQLVTEK